MVRLLFQALALVAAGSLGGCGTVSVPPPSHEDLERVVPPLPDPAVLPRPVDMLALTPAMRDFARQYTPTDISPRERLNELLRALVNLRSIEYIPEAHLTAQEAFEQGRGNCLAFSSLVVAMAREVGLRARFQEVELPPDWSPMDDNLLVQYRHVNVLAFLPGREAMIDFRAELYEEAFPTRLLSDDQAAARLYNNLAIDALMGREFELALGHLRYALDRDPRLSMTWLNLGEVYRRMDEQRLAEISFRQALAVNPRDLSAVTNLANVYAETGRKDQARSLREFSSRHRERDAYYRYAMAQRAYDRGQFDRAREWLQPAVRRRPREHSFHHLMALSLWQLGEHEAAVRELQRAWRLADQSPDAKLYERQLAEWNQAS